MIDILQQAAAGAMATVILIRCVCVLYMTTTRHHRHPLLWLGFGYSYVILGSGAIFGACALVAGRVDLTEWALLLMLAGSCGLIAFDRRAAKCWTVTDCPMERPLQHVDRH